MAICPGAQKGRNAGILIGGYRPLTAGCYGFFPIALQPMSLRYTIPSKEIRPIAS